jgi:alpha-L-rhamnosidase
MKFIASLLPACLAIPSACFGFAVHHLETEYQKDPLGLDMRSPRVGWQIQSAETGQKQTAYRIIVSSSPEKLKLGEGDLWDSGKVVSDRSSLIKYAGKELRKNDDCYWKVKVWDKHGKESDWSDTGRFSIGPLGNQDWEGAWIVHPFFERKRMDHQWFRKLVDLDQRPTKSFIHVASSGYHSLFINGKKVGDIPLAPSLSRLDKRVLYETYEVTEFLKVGRNKIDIQYSAGWSNYKYFKSSPGLKADVFIKSDQAGELRFSTDASWRCITGHGRRTGGIQYRDHGGEEYDMGKLDAELRQLSLDTVDEWGPPVRIVEKDVEISADLANPNKVLKVLKPVDIDFGSECKIDMGINYTGMLEIEFPPGSGEGEIVIKVADDAVGASYGKQPPGQDFGQRNSVRLRADGSGLFRNTFNYISGRYITLEGLKKPLSPDHVRVHVIANGFEQVGSFSSSSDLFNGIYKTDLWTFIANSVEGLTMDCPHRERLGYGEVAYATAWGLGMPNYRSGAFYRKFLQDWCDVQTESGWIHHTAPQINDHFGGTMWSSAPVNIAFEFYRTYGDLEVLGKFYPTGLKWVRFLEEHLDENDVLVNYAKTQRKGHFLGDWAAPGDRKEWGDTIEAQYFNTCTFLMVVQKMEEMAAALDRAEDLGDFGKLEARLKKGIHERFYNKNSDTYVNGTQTQLAFALWRGVPPERLRSRVYDSFVKSMQAESQILDMGSSGLPVLLSYILEDAKRADLLAPLVQKTEQPSYGFFLERGETTWPEYWSVDVPSKIHTCYTGIASFFTMGLAGINRLPDHPGMKHFQIKPTVVDGLAHVRAERASVYGVIRSEWKNTPTGFELAVDIPVNSTAEVVVPKLGRRIMTVNNRAPGSLAEVQVLSQGADSIAFKLQSGVYRFRSPK